MKLKDSVAEEPDRVALPATAPDFEEIFALAATQCASDPFTDEEGVGTDADEGSDDDEVERT